MCLRSVVRTARGSRSRLHYSVRMLRKIKDDRSDTSILHRSRSCVAPPDDRGSIADGRPRLSRDLRTPRVAPSHHVVCASQQRSPEFLISAWVDLKFQGSRFDQSDATQSTNAQLLEKPGQIFLRIPAHKPSVRVDSTVKISRDDELNMAPCIEKHGKISI